MIEIKTGTLEEKILRILQTTYPITVEQLRKQLGIPRSIIEIELKKLQSKGILLLEPLPDKVFIRLIRTDFRFLGTQSQERFIKRKTGKRETRGYDDDGDDEGIMFG